eukprot:555385_1
MKTKLGEFKQETIEAELNKYKKGVFYHDDESKINGHENSQYQLTRTQQAPPQLYEELPRPVPPNYEEKKRKQRVRTKRDRDVVTIAPYAAGGGRGGGYSHDYYYYPQDYYYAPQSRYPPVDYKYGYTTTSTSYPYDHGVMQGDGSWYPYPGILQQQPPPQDYVHPYATPMQSRTRRNGNKGALSITLTSGRTALCIGKNRHGEFGIGNDDEQKRLMKCDWSEKIQIRNIYAANRYTVIEDLDGNYYSSGWNRNRACTVNDLTIIPIIYFKQNILTITPITYFKQNNIKISQVFVSNMGDAPFWKAEDGSIYTSCKESWGPRGSVGVEVDEN